jgi:hypothetical protein
MRYILRYRGQRPPPGDELDRVTEYPDVELIDHAIPGLALVEAPEERLTWLRRLLPDWLVEQEHQTTLPSTWPGTARSR